MLDDDKITEIFVGTEIIFHVNDEKHEPDIEVVLAALKKHKQKAKGELEENEKYIL